MQFTEESQYVYTVKEVAEIFRVGRSTVYSWVRTGAIPSLHLGRGRVFIPDKWVREQLAGTTFGVREGTPGSQETAVTPEAAFADAPPSDADGEVAWEALDWNLDG